MVVRSPLLAQVLDETLQDPDCNRAQLAAALMKMDPELPEAQASLSAVRLSVERLVSAPCN